MKPHSRLVFFTLVTLLVMLVNLAMPVPALADDSAPPETPPAEVPSVEAPPEEAPPPEEPISLPEVLEQAPPDTQVVVVNDEGEVEPLATVEAAEILVTGDPVWCPEFITPGTDTLGECTSSHSDFSSLLSDLATNNTTYTGNGTIFVEDVYSADEDVVINSAAGYGLGDLVIQGGWDFTNDMLNASDPYTYIFDGFLHVYDWIGNVTVNNFWFYDSDDTGLLVESTGDIAVNDVVVEESAGYGANLDACMYDGSSCAGTGTVDVTDSQFNMNNFSGLVTDSGGITTLTNVTASDNVNGTGVDVLSDGGIMLNNVTADGNRTGAIVDTTFGTGSVTVDGGQFDDNDYYGLVAYSAGSIEVSNVIISDNSSPGLDTYGAYLNATYGKGTILVEDSTFNNNDGYGVFGIANNNVTLTDVDVNGGGITDDGAKIKSINGTATVNGGTFTNNTKSGLIAIGGFQVDLVDVNVTANLGDGARVYSTFTYACFGDMGIPVNVNGGTYTNNGGVPLTIKPGPDGTVVVSTAPAPTISGNGGGDIVIDLGNPCLDKDEEKPEGKPVNIVEVPFKDGDPVPQDCVNYSGTLLMLPDGTWVKFGCPFEGSMTLEGLLEEELPGPLGAGAEFVSAITYGMTDMAGLEVTVNPDGTITLKFKIPEASNARAYDILYWDTSANNGTGAWVTLPQYKIGQPQAVALNPGDPEDGRLITSGVKQKGEYVTVTVNFTGTFVLVAR